MQTEMKEFPTGCTSVDAAFNHGVHSGSITQIYGESSTGKTNVLATLAANTIINGGDVAIISKEATTFDRTVEIIQRKTEDESVLDNLLTYQVTSFSEQDEAINNLKQVFPLDMVLVDGIGGLYRLERGKTNDEFIVERKLTRQITLLKSYARKYHCAVVVTNQIYNNPETGTVEPLGGAGLENWFDTIMYLESFDENKRCLTVEKHRYGKEGERAWFEISDDGINTLLM